jgi:DNA-binding NtrC family response regulator
MKRILIIDESEAIRETLALILGREFIVSKKSYSSRQFRLGDGTEDIDLLILGIAPPLVSEALSVARFASQLPFAVLFLVDSRATARAIVEVEPVSCLTKPFNPYELHATVGELLNRRETVPAGRVRGGNEDHKPASRYLEYPFLSRSVASIIQRYASTRLPILISGEIGCGQYRVARGIPVLANQSDRCVSINAAHVTTRYLTEKALELAPSKMLTDVLPMLVLDNLDKCPVDGQNLLLDFLEDQEDRLGSIRPVTTTNEDLLERVYRGEFLDALYSRLATLTLKLLPLRERQPDIPILAEWFAREYAAALGISEPNFSTEAIERLANYLWFGNLNELSMVIARTLTLHGGGTIEADDLIFDFAGDGGVSRRDFSDSIWPEAATADFTQPKLQIYTGSMTTRGNSSTNGHVKAVDLSVVIHELAHELKNPMVTIKTFAQLLGERYDDESFRARFQEIVGGDIERMDELLEVMVEYADFGQPKRSNVALGEKLRDITKEVHSELVKRQARFQWKDDGAVSMIHTDEQQLGYILKNVLLAVLSQAKMGGEISLETGRDGSLIIGYLREAARMASISQYLTTPAQSQPTEGVLPLRILLAKQLVERNRGRLNIDQSDPEKDILRLEFPIG